LCAAPTGTVPEDVLHAMRSIARVAAFRSAELADAAAVAADALRAANLAPLWLKGAALAMQHESEFGLRGMGDLDLLLPAEQHNRARHALHDAGWQDGAPGDSYEMHHHAAPLVSRSGVRLELHGALFPTGHPFTDDRAEVWQSRAVSRSWRDRVVAVLPPEWHIVHASTHWAWSHEGAVGTWQYLHDMRVLSGDGTSGAPRWDQVVSHARALGAAMPVGWALWAAARLGEDWGVTGIDEAVIADLRGQPRWLTGMAERQRILQAFHSPAASPSVRWTRFWWRYAMDGLGEATDAWPWSAGRMDVAPSPATSEIDGEKRVSRSFRRWHQHLDRVLRG
jgi:Uncharacterised nucleotidyltransferase